MIFSEESTKGFWTKLFICLVILFWLVVFTGLKSA